MTRPLLTALALLSISSIGFAGMQSSATTSVVTYSSGAGYASGAVAATHDSSDSSSFVYCQVLSSTTVAEMVFCSVKDSAGNTASCWSYDAGMVASARTMGDASNLTLYFDTSAECTTLYAYNSSIYL
ncbi:MAG: hypothetical protein H6741_21275 [Alphaproteobacteria bacterium]|nr:hypothetical protein [Alphaproteobacteria bacterium]